MIRVLPILLVLCISCDRFSLEGFTDDPFTYGKTLASIKDSVFLYESELNDLLSENSTPEDSARLIKSYRNNWIERELMLMEATSKTELDQRDIERRIEEYRYQLIIYEFQKEYINQNLNTKLEDSVVQNYFETYKDNFVLKTNIVRGYFLKLPKNSPSLSRVRSWMTRGRTADFERLEEYADKHAIYSSLEDELWIEFKELIKDTPFQKKITNEESTLRRSKFLESKDDEFVYYYWIKEYKTVDENAPFQFAETRIKDILLNQRKVDMLKNLEDSIIQSAKRSRLYKIYEY